MAATIDTKRNAKILIFERPCKGVEQTDSKRRLPPITSAEVESIFDHAWEKKTRRRAV